MKSWLFNGGAYYKSWLILITTQPVCFSVLMWVSRQIHPAVSWAKSRCTKAQWSPAIVHCPQSNGRFARSHKSLFCQKSHGQFAEAKQPVSNLLVLGRQGQKLRSCGMRVSLSSWQPATVAASGSLAPLSIQIAPSMSPLRHYAQNNEVDGHGIPLCSWSGQYFSAAAVMLPQVKFTSHRDISCQSAAA